MSATDRRIKREAYAVIGRRAFHRDTIPERQLEDWCIYRVRRATRSKVRSVLAAMQSEDLFGYFSKVVVPEEVPSEGGGVGEGNVRVSARILLRARVDLAEVSSGNGPQEGRLHPDERVAGGAVREPGRGEAPGGARLVKVSPETLAEVRAAEEADKPYWRIFLTQDFEVKAVCLQPFDEQDYDQASFLSEVKYPTEEGCQVAAEAWKARVRRTLPTRTPWW